MCIHTDGVRRSHTYVAVHEFPSSLHDFPDPILARGFLLRTHTHIYICIYFLNDIRNSHLPSGRCGVRCLAYMRVPPGANSSDIIVDVRDAHVALAHGRPALPLSALHTSARARVRATCWNRARECGWECVAPLWRRPAELQRSAEIARQRRRHREERRR